MLDFNFSEKFRSDATTRKEQKWKHTLGKEMQWNEKEGKGDTTSTEKSTSRNPSRQLFEVLFIMPINALRIVCSSLSHFPLSSFPMYVLLSVPFLLSFSFLFVPSSAVLQKKYLTPGTQYMSRLLSGQNWDAHTRPHLLLKAPHLYFFVSYLLSLS